VALKERRTDHIHRAVVVLLLLVSWALRLQRLEAQDIWWDEARNIEVATRALAQIATSPELDIHPPLYFYSLHLWTQCTGVSAFATRLFSAWFGLLAIAFSYRLARGLVPGRHGRLAGLLTLSLAAFSAYGLAEAQETRMYTLSWTLLSAAMLTLWQATRSRPRSTTWLWWAGFVLLSMASLLTHYANALILLTWAIWLLAWALRGPDRRTRLRTLALAGFAAALLCLPVAPIALRQIPGYYNPNLNLPELSGYLSQLFRAFTLGEYVPETAWSVGRWLWLLFPLGGALLALRKPHKGRNLALLGLWLGGGLALYYGVLIRRSAFNPRYISFVLPPLWALAGWALTGWRQVTRSLPWLLGAALVGVSIPSLHADLTETQHFHDDTRGVVAWLQDQATPEDIILVDQRYPFGFYWQRWNNDAYGFPPGEPADQPPAQYLFVDINHVDERLTELAREAETVYWVTWFESDTDPRGSVPALLDAHGERLGEQEFRGYQVCWWRLQPPTQFHLAQELMPLNLRFELGMILLEGDWQGRLEPTVGDRPALLTLRWQAEGPTTRPLKVSLRLRDEQGTTVSQDDRTLLNDRHLRTTFWQPGESATTVYSLGLPPAPGVYTLTLVLYDETTLEPVGLLDGTGVEPQIGTLRTAP
jgi:mannosyltransferase